MVKRGSCELKKIRFRKSQITLFIIFGLIIVFAAIFIIYVSSVSLFFQPSKIVPEDVGPIKNLIEQCLEDNAQPLIAHMMAFSGYTDLSKFRTSNLYIPELRVPYSLPQIREDMEKDLKYKMVINLKTCIDFAQFEQFNVNEKKPFELTVKINDEDVTLSIKYPLEIVNKHDNKVTKLLDFKKIIQTKLGKLSDLARAIMKQENNGIDVITRVSETSETRKMHFLEEMTLDVIRSNSPFVFPYEGLEFTADERKWSIENNLKPDLTLYLWANLGCITYQGTASQELPESCIDPEEDSSYYQKFSIPLTSDPKYRNTRITLTPKYKEGVIDFKEFSVSPSNGDTVEAMSLFQRSINPITHLIGRPFKLYHHSYHIEYPVLFSLSEGDTFNFATEVIIKDNMADRENQFYFSTAPAFSLDIFCKDEEGAKEYTVQAVDKLTGLAIRDVDIQYQCVQYVCDMGKTSPDLIPHTNIERIGSTPKLTSKFPFCYNGVLVANKENYKESTKIISEDYQENDIIKIEMTPLVKLDYEFIIVEGLARRTELDDNETLMIMLLNEEQNYNQQLFYSPELEREPFELLVGSYTYNIFAQLTKDEVIIGGFMGDAEITASRGDKTIVFSIIADSQLVNADEETVASFLGALETKSQEELYKPVIKW